MAPTQEEELQATVPEVEESRPRTEEPIDRTSESKRLSVTLRAQEMRALAQTTEDEAISANDAIRQAINVDAFIRKAIKQGRRVLIEDTEGNFREIEFVRT